jgi:hypothetical protein
MPSTKTLIKYLEAQGRSRLVYALQERGFEYNLDLKKEDFSDLNLAGVSFKESYLISANFKNANLKKANFHGAVLSKSNCRGANLQGANLLSTDLLGSDFHQANLTGTCLDPKAEFPLPSDRLLKQEGVRVVGDKVYGFRTYQSQSANKSEGGLTYKPRPRSEGGLTYKPRPRPYVAPYFSVSKRDECHPGIYIAGLSYMSQNYSGLKWVRCYCLRSELLHVGDKWRCKRLWSREIIKAQQYRTGVWLDKTNGEIDASWLKKRAK